MTKSVRSTRQSKSSSLQLCTKDHYAVSEWHGHQPTGPAYLPVTIKLHVPGHLAMRDCIRQLLQFQSLEVHTLALVRHDKVWVQWALWAPSLIPGQGKKWSLELP